jgi:dienelactone hydrolase
MPRPCRHSPLRKRWIALAFTGLCALLAASPLWLLAQASFDGDSAETGASGADSYRVVLFGWFDAARGREVPARLFWPRDARPGSVPLVVFSHGIGSSDDGYTHLGRHWANHGIASLHVRHVGSDRSMWEGNPLWVMQRIEQAASEQEAVQRATDLRFVLDQFLAGAFSTYVDPTRISVAGHSYGANTAMLLAGARVQRDGQALALADPRVSAAILISAPPFYGDTDLASILGDIAIPSLHVTTTEDIIRLPGYGSGVDDRMHLFAAMGGDRTLALFDRGSHNVFTDRRYFDSAAVADGVKAATQRLTLVFLQSLGAGRDAQFRALATLGEPGLAVQSVQASPHPVAVAHAPNAGPLLPPRRSAP